MLEPVDRRPYAIVTVNDPLILMEAVGILREAGFRTFEAGHAEDTIAILSVYHASIVLAFTDVDMTGAMNGFELARLMAATWPHVSILVASGHRDPAPGDMPPGAHFVAKPFNSEVVRNRLRQILPEGQKPEELRY